MAPGATLPEDAQRDAAFQKAMHGKSAEARHAFLSMLNKDDSAHRLVTDSYVQRWSNDSKYASADEAREARKAEYMGLVNNYYDLVTDLYEEGWAQSFHFCRFGVGEGFLQALARHEHYMAHRLGLRQGMRVLDVGCGVGRPAREIALFAGCEVVGLNNNGYQIERATAYAEKEDLAHLVSFVKGDFMHMDFPDNSFDAIYAIEATVHAPSLAGVYSQIHRVLKPGGKFGVYEWVMTDAFDATNPSHVAVRLGIERGSGIAHMQTRAHAAAAMTAAGFELELQQDLAAPARPDRVPWWYPLAGEWRYARSLWDALGVVRMSWVGRKAMGGLLSALEAVRVAPRGTAETAEELARGAEALVEGGKMGLFTPMYFMVGRKPEA
ncbi:Delta(24)-sterol C-methyltransferase [Diplodia seriata]